MTDKHKTIEQCDLAFTYLQKLYHEVSYLIKEVEGDLGQETEEFVIGRPGGYQITAKSSAGLEPKNVDAWLRRKMSVFFVPKGKTSTGSSTTTPIDKDLRVIYVRVVLDDDSNDFEEPKLYFGVIYNITNSGVGKGYDKFEKFLGHFEYNDGKIFQGKEKFPYQDSYLSFGAELKEVNLFDINDSEAIKKKIVEPALSLFRTTR
ncbi:hypothetical protein MUP77_04485 [Candidatus Bathyarchaeota archaeon]|nr:hypothetical protein [Candidatus Bathyarchaeota archaeon]